MKPNRLFQDQQQFTPVLTQQQPVITNQQYGQPFIQQSQRKNTISSFNLEKEIFLCF